MPVARDGDFQGNDQRLSFVHDRGDLAQYLGTARSQQTGNPLDVAIDGERFLVVQTPARRALHARRRARRSTRAASSSPRRRTAVLGENGPIQFQPHRQQHR